MWSNSAPDTVKWKDLMSTLILDRLEASFDNWDDELPQKPAQMTQNTKTDCDIRPQCTTVGGESSRMEYFDSASCDDNLGHLHTNTDRDSIACTSVFYDCSTDGFLDGNNNCCRCSTKPQYSLSSLSNNLSRESVSEKIKKNEIENIKQQVEIYRKRLECMLKMNYQLQFELQKSIRKNLLMEQHITWPYAVNNGKVEFPGKNDLDQRFDCLFKELEKVRNDLKPIQNDNYIVSKLEKILHIPLPGCLNTCNKYMNKK
ncbi:uncharacterized protein LOC111039999 [Myzus persicae]|uniref:uncharacterized protein LOC111039999 n=1 Tax=Myzus persicae TaxID=13164 RepID=UPI000B9324F6|nr:uncharacterized protein LOC111039999 [Myzus persicae]